MEEGRACVAYYNSDTPARAARLFKIVTLVASRRPGERLGREQLAEACECTSKTIQRDIQCLQDAHIPIEYDTVGRTYTLCDRGWTYPLVQMTATDAMALALARRYLTDSPSPLPFRKEIADALRKATSGLTPALRSLLESTSHGLSDRGGTARDYSRAPLGLLLESISAHETVEMTYDSRSSHTCERRIIDPYRLDRRDGRYFDLQAWCHRREEVRTFALDRISDVRKTGERFVPRTWDESDEGVVGGLRGGDPVSVEVRFHPQVTAYAKERRWGFRAEWEGREDGSLVMRGTVRGVEGIVRELLGWQRYVEVLGGPELRTRMAEEVRAMAALYEEQPMVAA